MALKINRSNKWLPQLSKMTTMTKKSITCCKDQLIKQKHLQKSLNKSIKNTKNTTDQLKLKITEKKITVQSYKSK